MKTFEFKSLERNYLKVFRLSMVFTVLLLAAGPTVLFSAVFDFGWALRAVTFLLSFVGFFVLAFWYSIHWYKAYKYMLNESGLKIRKGVFWQTHNMLPRNRVQHIDITTGPLERRYDLSKLVVHTAGTRNATVTLPGLLHGDATDLRQELINSNQGEDTV